MAKPHNADIQSKLKDINDYISKKYTLNSPKKRRGLVLRDWAELGEFAGLINDERLKKLMAELDQVNPKRGGREQGGEVLEI